MPTLSSCKIDQYEHLKGEEVTLFKQSQMIEQAKVTYFPFEKAFEKQTKATTDQGEKQIKALVPLNFFNKISESD